MNIIFFIIFFPLLSFLYLSLNQGTVSLNKTRIVGIISVFLSFSIFIFYSMQFFTNKSLYFQQKLWNLISIDGINIDVSFFLDGLSLSMLGVVTGIGAIIHLFSIWYTIEYKEGLSRFFAYTNLFIASMLILVLADNFILMYFGWEGVSVCSYLLISFYYTKLSNVYCALKAFIITRISDIFLIIAFFLIYQKYHTFNFQDIEYLLISPVTIKNQLDLNLINIFLFLGVIGKSAQLPLHTWLTSAMVGPTPVSALIHAATMVTAGVYLIARTHFLFLLTPEILYFISIIGVLTIFISSFSALLQHDIKRILAYSTMSQIGYMFLALGVQAWNAAIIHLIIHAIFKALLFLSTGSLISICKHEQNIFKMGCFYKKFPFLYSIFLISGASLASFPLITAGFYSKGNILLSVLDSGNITLFIMALFGSFLTAIYTFRMIFVVFHRNNFLEKKICKKNIFFLLTHNIPLIILLILSTFIGSWIVPPLNNIFPILPVSTHSKIILEIVSSILSCIGIWIAYYLWIKNVFYLNNFLKYKISKKIFSIVFKGWGFDHFYNFYFVKLYLFISQLVSCYIFNIFNYWITKIIKNCNKFLLQYSNGCLKWYLTSMILGMIFIFTFILCLI